MSIEHLQPSGGCFKNRFLIVTFSATQCVEEDVTGFIVNCSGSTCISERVDCPPTVNITELTVTLGARTGSHEVNVYAVNRCHPATRTVDAPIDGKSNVYLHNNVFAHGTVTNDDDDDDDRVSRSKGWANWTKLTPINTFRGTS